MEVSGHLHVPVALSPTKWDPGGTQWVGGWMGPRASMKLW